MNLVMDEVLNFLAAGATSEQILEFKPSEAALARVHELLEQNRTVKLTQDEIDELEEDLQINHFMIMLKIRAQKHQLDTGHTT